MNDRVLFVDDESNVLDALKRAIRKDCSVSIAVGPEDGLAAVANNEPFALIVADMRMPGMDGIEFLRAVKQLSPDSVRMMLTGNADQETAVTAVNEGEVFRFLTKPCDVAGLRQAIGQGLRQYELVTAEKVLLNETLMGSISVLSDVLALARPDVFGRTHRLQKRVRDLIGEFPDLPEDDRWQIDTAALLSQLGCVSLRPSTLAKLKEGADLDSAEQRRYWEVTEEAARLVARIPRMEAVAEIIRYQHKQYIGGGWPEDSLRAESLPLGARALHLALAEDQLRARGYDASEVSEELGQRSEQFDPRLLERLTQGGSEEDRALRVVPFAELEVGMEMATDVLSRTGTLLVCAGQKVTDAVLDHLRSFDSEGALPDAFDVHDENSREAPPEVANG